MTTLAVMGDVPSFLPPTQTVGYAQTPMDFWIITGVLLVVTLVCATVSLALCRSNIRNDTFL
jgi:hypothetical protein